MNTLSKTSEESAYTSKWHEIENYRWMIPLPRLGWAWEFLRRSPRYRSVFAAALVANMTSEDVAADPEKNRSHWPLVRLRKPRS